MKKKNQLVKSLISSALLIPAVVSIQAPSTEAATSTQIASAVQKAVSASQVLRRATSIEDNGDGKTKPYVEFNNTKAAYAKAISMVKSMPSSNSKVVYETKLKDVEVKIKNATNYIDAISSGEKILAKKNELQAHVNKGILTQDTVNLYHSLSREITKQGKILDPVYGKTTREFMRAYYKESAEKLKKETIYAVTVKMAADLISSNASNEENLKQSKEVLRYLPAIPQQAYKKQLTAQWESLKGKVPASIQDAEYKNLEMIYENLIEIETIVKPGVSSSNVPVLYEETKNGISKVEIPLAKQKMEEALKAAMSELFLPVSEIKTLLTKKAAEKGIPPEIVKAIALTENGNFQQFEPNGEVFKSFDNGYGIMQVTSLSEEKAEKVKYDLSYNIEEGINILLEKWNYASVSRIPVINDGAKDTLENWYFAVMAYNGLSKSNDPTFATNKTYQEKVFANLSSMNPELIKEEDLKITYNSSTGQMLFNDKMLYTTTKKTKSVQLFKSGESIVLPSEVNLRSVPTTENNTPLKKLSKGTTVTLLSGPTEDNNKYNIFTWYKVKVNATGQIGYIASIW
jgi:hypothetical protein